MINLKEKFQDISLIFWTYLLILIGLLLLFSASKGVITREGFFLKQCMWVIGGTVIIGFLKNFDYRHLNRISTFLYFLILFFLLLVLFIGHGRASRWIKLGWFNFQPAEFAKIVVIITLSAYLSRRDVRRFPVFFLSVIIVGIPFLLVLKQPNLGTAFIFILIFLGIIYEAGLTRKQFIFLFLSALFLSPLLWFIMRDYQRERILTFLFPQRDPLGAGYNLFQSKITIGSGGLIGKGFLQGTQTKLAFLPEYHTDFIFCLLAEEFGFVGVIVLLLIYFIFFKTIIDIISSTSDRFAKLLGAGIFTMFISQFTINIGMTMGLFPVVGIPLPFISYGGSSLIVSLISVVFLVNIKENSLMF
ncbi:rod shape-determining protein RodA [bacterium]|nr:rod shape-determining protein RodA [bacterium]